MDENLLTLLEELTLRASYSEEEGPSLTNTENYHSSSNYGSSHSNTSSPNFDQLMHYPNNDGPNSANEQKQSELENAVYSLFNDMKPSKPVIFGDGNTGQNGYGGAGGSNGLSTNSAIDCNKAKLMLAVFGEGNDLFTRAVKTMRDLVGIGKRLEEIVRRYYQNNQVELNSDELGQLIVAFSNLYNNETWIQDVNISRLYKQYCKKVVDIYYSRNPSANLAIFNTTNQLAQNTPSSQETEMVTGG